jgi:hypothetical protein
MAKNLFNRYIWLVDTIYRAKKISFEEINEKWKRNEMSNGKDMPLRTFHNHREAIEEMFDINIECERFGEYYYYIENKEDMEKGGIRSWLLNTFAVNNLINESHHLKRRILFENIPSGREYLTPIIEAMRDNLTLSILYQTFYSDTPHEAEIEPYCVKVFKQRWYVVAFCKEHKEVRIYALDRIQELHTTEHSFVYPKDFDPQEYFYDSFGIIVNDDIPTETVRIKVLGKQRNYIRALPLHISQTEIEKADDYSIFEYRLKPSFDFRQELLSQGGSVEVLEPKWFREEMKEALTQMIQHYQD